MPKVSKRPIGPQEQTKFRRELIRVVEVAAKEGALGHLIEDLLTPMEIKMLAKRVQVVRLLLKGVSYQEIESHLKVQSNTISRVKNKAEASPTRALRNLVIRALKI